MVYFGVAVNGSFYRAASPVYTHLDPPKDGNDQREFVVVFQTSREKALRYPAFKEKVRQTTELWGGKRGREVGELADTESELVRTFGGDGDGYGPSFLSSVFQSSIVLSLTFELTCGLVDEAAAPFIIEMKIFGDDIETKVQPEQIVDTVSKLDGYRRTLLYRPQENSVKAIASVTLICEFKSLTQESLLKAKERTEKAQAIKDYAFQLRSYELQGSEGFGGVCNVPARL